MDKETKEKMFGEFDVRCKKCKSDDVYVDNTLGYSAMSGGWGEISLCCNECGNEHDMFENW